MASKHHGFRFDHPVVITFLIFSVIGFMSLAADVLKPLALSVLLSFALAPIARFLERRGIPRFLSVVLTVLLTVGVLAGVGYKVGEQFATLAAHMKPEELKKNVQHKFRFLKAKQSGAIEKLSVAATEISRSFDQVSTTRGAVPVNVVTRPSLGQRLKSAVGPYVEDVGVGVFVLILVLFMLANREDLSDRIIRLFGRRRVSLTTKTMDEAAQRISRYLVMFATVNSSVGLIVGIGLSLIGVPLAALWGTLAAFLRFFPYVGPMTAFGLPFAFSMAAFHGWREPLMVAGLFLTLELAANSYLEPVIYGKTTGVSSLGLLVAALFWTWLWGILGLLLSTPMTVCLAVLGKYVPGLRFFTTLLSEDPPLETDLRFYHRLLAMDQDGASQIVEAELKQRPRAEVFDRLLLPTLSRAELDRRHDELDEAEFAFIHRFISDLLDELAETPEVDLKTLSRGDAGSPTAAAPVDGRAGIVAVAAEDQADALVLRMLAQLLEVPGCPLTIVAEPGTPLQLTERVARLAPRLVLLSYLPPSGLTATRYLVRRLRARSADVPILVGRWGEGGDVEEAASALTEAGASSIVFTLGDARNRILDQVCPTPKGDPSPLPAERTTPLGAPTPH